MGGTGEATDVSFRGGGEVFFFMSVIIEGSGLVVKSSRALNEGSETCA